MLGSNLYIIKEIGDYFSRYTPLRSHFIAGVIKFAIKYLSAFAVSASAADGAAAFMFNNSAAIRTGTFEKGPLLINRTAAIGRHMGLNGSGHRIGAGQYLVLTESRGRMAGNALKLLDYLSRLYSAAPGKGHHASYGFAL